jgi:hypothetical protein
LIEQLDEDNYRAVYGTFSTIATASQALRIINSRSNLAVSALTQWVSACSEHGGVLDSNDDWSHSSPAGTAQVSNSATPETGKLKVVCPLILRRI